MRLCLKVAVTVLGLGLAGDCALAEGEPKAVSEASAATARDQQVMPGTGLASEIGAAVAIGSKATNAEREDRVALAKFYEARQYEPAWITPTGIGAKGQAVVAELAKADDWGLEASAFKLPSIAVSGGELSRSNRANLDVAVSLAVLKYARHAKGGRLDPTSLSKFIDRKPTLADPLRVIEEAAKADAPDAYLRGLHPQHPQFERLRQKYLALKQGQPAATPTGDGKKPAASAAASAQRLLVNMEEWRWMPESLGDYYVWVNVPEYLIRVVKDGKVIHTERVVVGKNDTQTPIFSHEMEQVIFHPFWGIPDSIKQADILPTLQRGSTRMMERYNLRMQANGKDIEPLSVDWTSTDIRKFYVYQPPGDTNLLGVVKFRFPNRHDVYMHDTPQKFLFNATARAYSHGCMRVREPVKLAQLLLAEDQGWSAERVTAAAAPGAAANNQVNLKHKIPVHITYFTAWVDDDGKLKTFADIYEHESKITLGLEGKANLIPRWKEDKAPATADAVGSLSEASAGAGGAIGQKQDWARRAFQN